jgi:hypothetical protein|tara:strand:- start:4564 stop:6501 length:1938 start_codon:yes stop_codon:yes gene_type:complete
MATPLVRIPQPMGGTMYAFASSARDMTRAFNSSDLNFEFSKYALLDLPDFTDSVNGSNTIDFETNLKQPSGQAYVAGMPNVDFAQTFQNYALNLEELLLKDDDYDPIILQSDAEKIFFKWMSHLGAVDFIAADSNQTLLGNYTEKVNGAFASDNYDRLVKYLGTIDVENDVAYQGNTYHEVYINVPTSVGYTPTVLFRPTDYNTTATKLYASDYIEGREGQTHPDPNININTVVDDYTLSSGAYYNIQTNATNSVGINFDANAYEEINNNSDVQSILDFSKKGQRFRFNAILVYYDIYSESVPANRATNLYGVLILDDIQDAYGPGSKINEQIKYKPNEVTGLNGNSFSLKLNMKFNSSLDNVGVETSVNDFTTFSMDLFMDTTTALENATEVLLQANNRYAAIVDRLNVIENIVSSTEDTTSLSKKVQVLEDDFQSSSIQLADSNSLLELISKAHNKINALIDGTIPVELQYNTDVIFAGKGTEIDKTIPNKIKIDSTVDGYALNSPYLWNIAARAIATQLSTTTQFDAGAAGNGSSKFAIWSRLEEFSNRLSLRGLFSSEPESDVNIYIDDSLVSWKNGQTFKITFDEINMSGNNIKLWTNSVGGFDQLIFDIDSTQLITNKPYIELVCINSTNYQFEADILR